MWIRELWKRPSGPMEVKVSTGRVLCPFAASIIQASSSTGSKMCIRDRSIKVLEKKLSQPLFIRSTKKVQLTPEGEILLRCV